MGKPALPAIIAEMRSGDNFLWFAVMDITGVKPTDIGKSGNVTDLYLGWWDREGKNKFTELN